MTQRFFACLRFAAPILLLACCAGSPAFAQDKTRADELSDQGDYFFKAGYYFRAADNYRLALLEDPTSPWKKLAFGHSLFATGQYGYASYALRKGVAELDPTQTLAPEVAALFPSRRRFQQALRDLKRYVTYSPRDPAGLTVLGYVLYTVRGEERRCRDLFRYLQKLDPNDAFARYFLDQLDRRYLNMICQHFGGGPVGIETIAAGLSEPRDAIEDIIEPYMIQQGLIQRTPRGRVMTATAWKHLGLTPPKDADLTQFRLFDEGE